MDILLKIDKESVLGTVKMNASVVGRDEVDAGGNSLYPVVAITKRDEDVLDTFYNAAMSNLVAYLRALEIAPNEEGFLLAVPNFDAHQTGYATVATMGYIADYVTGSWLRLKGSKMWEPFMRSADASLENLRRLLLNRKASEKKLFGLSEEEADKETNVSEEGGES